MTFETDLANHYGPNAFATDYPPVFVAGDAPAHFAPTRWSNNLYIVGQHYLPVSAGADLTAIHLDGAGVYEGRFCTEPASFRTTNQERENFVNHFGNTARGAMALYLTDTRRNELLLLPDQMSAAIVFVYQGSKVSACSTSLRALVRTLRGLGVSLTKSPDFFLELLASEAGGLAPSSYEEISAAPLHSYATIGREGISFTRYRDFVDLYQPDLDYTEQLDIAVQEIVENAAVSATQPGTLTSHLTAGADSRLVGAALHAAGVDDKFVFYCAENAVTREQDVAQRVAGHMGWTMTRHPGGAAAYSIPGVLYKRHAILEASEGLKTVGPTEGNLRSQGLVLTGYNGEAIRSFYSSRVDSLTPGRYDGDAHLKGIWPRHFWDPQSSLVESEATSGVRQRLDAEIDAARDLGFPAESLGDYLYFKARNRYFAWHSAMESSRYLPQFSPLYSPAMVRLGLSVPLRDRDSGRIAFDLYRALAPRALEIPFDSQKFAGKVRSDWEELPIRDASHKLSPAYDGRTNPIPPEGFPTGRIPKPTREHIERARKIKGVTAADIAGEERYRRIVRQHTLLNDTPMSGILRKEPIRILTSKPANTRHSVRVLSRLVAYLPWYNDAP